MKTNQLPPLPTPKFTETIRGVPCITVTEHEHLIRAYALRPAQVQGEPVTVAVDHFDNGPFEAYTNRIYPSVEIGTKLYATPQPDKVTQVPLTDEQISFEAHNVDDRDWNDLRFRSSWYEGFLEGARFAEAHHGITAQDKKGTP